MDCFCEICVLCSALCWVLVQLLLSVCWVFLRPATPLADPLFPRGVTGLHVFLCFLVRLCWASFGFRGLVVGLTGICLGMVVLLRFLLGLLLTSLSDSLCCVRLASLDLTRFVGFARLVGFAWLGSSFPPPFCTVREPHDKRCGGTTDADRGGRYGL